MSQCCLLYNLNHMGVSKFYDVPFKNGLLLPVVCTSLTSFSLPLLCVLLRLVLREGRGKEKTSVSILHYHSLLVRLDLLIELIVLPVGSSPMSAGCNSLFQASLKNFHKPLKGLLRSGRGAASFIPLT